MATIVDYTCPSCWTDHPIYPNNYCPFEGRQPKPRPQGITAVERADNGEMARKIECRMAQRERAKAETERATAEAETQFRQQWRRAMASAKAAVQERDDRARCLAEAEATVIKSRETHAATGFVEAMAHRRWLTQLTQKAGATHE